TTASPITLDAALSSRVSSAATAAVANNSPSERESPVVSTAARQPQPSIPVSALGTPAADQLFRGSIAKQIVRDWTWLGQTASSLDNSDQQNKKDVSIQALETVFAQYGQ
ncbi:MAG: hypothetical protein ABSG53_27240, partial [Thermoguttaceae bacterium]